ncbi:MAG: hypothetical protein A2252_05210 [Elusimicrobia bacterium RIFOXYA2_FULL_39_19]|nr:MAG: hypothetical protein A2252_05210 [Elusimicrobia bacterium RIFOXYA2_FULL_39_19]
MYVRKREIFLQVSIFVFLLVVSFIKIHYIQKKMVYEKLNNEMMENINKFPGEVGIYIKDLKTGVVLSYNESKPFASASLVKIPIMAATFQAVEDGNMSLSSKMTMLRKYKAAGSGSMKRNRKGTKYTVEQLVYNMITDSDNTATNMLTYELGFGYINWVFSQKLGLEVTRFDRGIMDLRLRNKGIENYTTAKEMGDLLEKMYNKKLVSKESSNKMLDVLAHQKHNDRIPRFLPNGLNVAHKTGLLRGICHDAGIVFTDKGDFIVCVLTRDFGSYKLAKNFIGEVAYITYRCY